MALPQAYVEKDWYTEDEYFELESTAFGRWEYVDGEIRAMSGGTDDHNTIAVNIGSALRSAVASRGCRVYIADLKVHTGDGINTYPDVAVVCGPREYYRGGRDVITNPLLIVEVLSKGTEAYDRSDKFDHYDTIPSLVDYLLVEQDEACVMLFSREGAGWSFQKIVGLEGSLTLPSLGEVLRMRDIYSLIELG